MKVTRYTVALLSALYLATPALAVDGAREIHQACVATGCFPGDSPGFPVELTTDGSYVLTSNLQVPDENTTAIFSIAERVQIDLGGFVISGVTTCGGNPIVCSPLGSGVGIEIDLNGRGSVRNGSVRAMGSTGVQAAGFVENLRVDGNGGGGISNANGLTQNNEVTRNGGFGIVCAAGSAVNNLVTGNGSTGITGTVAPVVRGNRVRGNGGANDSPGIRTVDGFVTQNLISSNRGPGLQADGTTVYGDNSLRSNNLAAGPTAANQVVGGGTQLGPNLCQGVPCP